MTADFSFDMTAATELAKASEGSPIGELLARKKLEAQTRRKPPVLLVVPDDTDWAVQFKTVIPIEVRKKWGEKFAKDEVAYAVAVLTTQCEAIYLAGQKWTEDGVDITFSSPKFVEFFEATDERAAIMRLYGGADGEAGATPHIDWVASEILRGAGIGVRRDKQGAPLD